MVSLRSEDYSTPSNGHGMHAHFGEQAVTPMNEKDTRKPQPMARKPSQFHGHQEAKQERLDNNPRQLPARLQHIQHLPWIRCYEQQLKTENKSLNTQKSYFYGLRSLIETLLPNESILSEEQYERMSLGQLVDRLEPMNGRIDVWVHSLHSLKPSTFNARLAAARHFIKWLGHRWPDHLLRSRVGKRLPRTLTKRELSDVIEAAKESENPSSDLIVTLMLDTGLRVSEVCALNIDDIDLEDNSARVIGGKGDKDRLVLFTQRTLQALQRWFPIRHSFASINQKALIVNRFGRRLNSRAIQRIMDALAGEIGLPQGRLTPHVLRHNFATGLLERGADLVSIQRLMGHATIATTRVYLEISDQTLREVYHRAQSMRAVEEQDDVHHMSVLDETSSILSEDDE
jgi:site-specific recombinase XerD